MDALLQMISLSLIIQGMLLR